MVGEWEAVTTHHLTYLTAGGASSGSLRLRRHYLGHLAGQVDCGPWEVTTADLLRFMSQPNWKPETRKTARTVVRSFYGWALDEELITVDPSRRLPPVPIPPTVPKPVPDALIHSALAATTDPRHRLMICSVPRRGFVVPRLPAHTPATS